MPSQLELKFHEEMKNIYFSGKKELGYNATRFWQLVCEKGGVPTAKILIAKDGGADGFVTLWKSGRLDLSVEAHVLYPLYKDLFTDEERQLCKDRLESYGYTGE